MKIGLIADHFTQINLEMEPGVKVINLTPASWRVDAAIHNIDLLLVESAWLGYKNKWQRKIASYGSRNIDPALKSIVDYCKKKNIPTVFWNKEDPINYERFKHNLDYFDVCLTTESSLEKHYKSTFSNLVDVKTAPFFFQPKLHNPTQGEVITSLSDKVIFCGGLYEEEFPCRAQRLKDGITSIGSKNTVVFDRFNETASQWSSISNIDVRPSFTYENSKKHYQSGLAQLNVNSFDGSKSMFSRRMLELVACGAAVIDLTAFKGKGLLSQYVTQVSNKHDILSALEITPPCIDFDFLIERYSAATFLLNLKTYI